MNLIKKRINELRALMVKNNIDYYIVPTSDYHNSEFVSEYFMSRKYITGFTGSAGTAIIGLHDSYLWTDGRYFIQGEKELIGTDIKLIKSGMKGVPTITEFLSANLLPGMTLGFDGKLMSSNAGIIYKKIADENKCKIKYQGDLIDIIWNDRPPFPAGKVYTNSLLKVSYPSNDKLRLIRERMIINNADLHLVSSIDDICWTLNIRGSDISYSPLVLCYTLIGPRSYTLYIDDCKLNPEILDYLHGLGVEIRNYDQVYEDISTIESKLRLMLDKNKINYAMYMNIPSDVEIIDAMNPETYLKSIKSDKEIGSMKIAQMKDSIAHVRFMKWLKENANKIDITEISAIKKLDCLRKSMGGYIMPSFSPISATGKNAAIIHYSPYEESDTELITDSLFLMDTGANYYEGTTDITRTYAIGDIPYEMKRDFILVVLSNLYLANAIFPYGVNGVNLDTFARKPLWDRHIDFIHGTGHGIGNLLNVHESPIGIRTHYVSGETETFRPGMIVTDEPGIYIENSHGVRLENELLVVNDQENEFGDFLKFEIMTLIPFDLDALLPEIMSSEERKMLNDYHRLVFDNLKPHLNSDEVEWLRYYTRNI